MIPKDIIEAAELIERADAEAALRCEVVGIVRVMGAPPSPAQARLSDKEQRRHDIALPLLGLSGSELHLVIRRVAAENHVSVATLYGWVKRVRAEGAAGLRRKRRSDAGGSSLSPAVQEMLRALLSDPTRRNWRLSLIIATVRQRFPEASQWALRALARQFRAAESESKPVEWWVLQICGKAAIGEQVLRARGWPAEAREPNLLFVRPVGIADGMGI